MGLLERVHKPLADALRKLDANATTEWVELLPVIMSWRNSSVNRDLGVCPHEGFFGRKPSFAYDRLSTDDVVSVTPNELANVCAAVDVLVRVLASSSAAMVTARVRR